MAETKLSIPKDLEKNITNLVSHDHTTAHFDHTMQDYIYM